MSAARNASPKPQVRGSWSSGVRILLGPVRALLLRRLSASFRGLPNVFVVGAVKAGTTSMAAYLERHPAYLPAFTKELIFLQDLPGLNGNEAVHPAFRYVWGRYRPDRLTEYRKFFPLASKMRAVARQMGSMTFTGDHTPFYLYCPEALRRIRRISPMAKILILLRDPVHRAFADFHMHRARNPQENRTFAQAVDEELVKTPTDFRRRYLFKSIYEPHVRRFREAFPEKQLRILRSEDFFDPKRTAGMMRDTFRFLGLAPIEIADFPAYNRGSYEGPLEVEVRRRLRDFFEPHNEKLRCWLGEDFTWTDPPAQHP